MAAHNQIGKLGEEIATKILLDKGYKIEQRNWRIGHLEVDIIASDKKTIAFVEVKTRTSTYGDKIPEESVDMVKRRRLIAAANAYIKYNHIEKTPRFDIIGIVLDKKNGEIVEKNHMEGAYTPGMRTINAGTFSGQWRWNHRRRVIK